MNILKSFIKFIVVFVFVIHYAKAQNPIISNQFTADPTARVFNNRVYVYPSHDILATKGKGRIGWFAMEDYHVFSSANLTDWTDHGMIVTQNEVPWVKPDSYSMWAPDCIERNGKYYFYFPTAAKDTVAYGRGFTIGVAVADKPEGPYVPEATPIAGVRGIDPNVFIDDFSSGLNYAAFGGSAPKAFQVDTQVKYAGTKSMRFEVPDVGSPEGAYAGGSYFTTVGRDLSGYNALSFYIKASQPANIDVIGFGNDLGENKYQVSINALPVNTNWKKVYIPIPDPAKHKS